MEQLDLHIIRYLSDGLKIGEIPQRLEEDLSIKASKSSVEKRLTILKKLHGAKTLFHLAIILKGKRLI